MKQMLTRVLRRLARPIVKEFEVILADASLGLNDEAATQKTLIQHYRSIAARGVECLPNLRDVGFRKYSQFEEDGMLLYLFALIRPINYTCVEICAGDGRECNTANLIINHGWWGHLFDGNEHYVRAGIDFFSRHKDTFLLPPEVHARLDYRRKC